jgi:hypothetical protein
LKIWSAAFTLKDNERAMRYVSNHLISRSHDLLVLLTFLGTFGSNYVDDLNIILVLFSSRKERNESAFGQEGTHPRVTEAAGTISNQANATEEYFTERCVS